mgnify:CR=1 FL=1
MTTDNSIVQPEGQVLSEGQVPPKSAEPPKPAEPLTADAVRTMIEEATAKSVAQAKEIGRRELQSQQDRNREELARATRRAQSAESALGDARTRLQTVDPDAAKDVEIAELRAREQGRTTQEQEETLARQMTEIRQNFYAKQTQFITNLGIDSKDKRIDWAEDAPDLVTTMGRIHDSVAKIQKENVQAIQTSLGNRLKELEKRVGKVAEAENIEVNSVETTTSPGVVAGSDAEFVKKFGAAELPYTKENEERYVKLRDNY